MYEYSMCLQSWLHAHKGNHVCWPRWKRVHMQECVKITHEHMCGCMCPRVCMCMNTWQEVTWCVPETRRRRGPAGSSLLPGSLRSAWAFFRPAAPEPWSWHLEVISLTNRLNTTIRVCAHCPFCVHCGSENIWFRSFDVIFMSLVLQLPLLVHGDKKEITVRVFSKETVLPWALPSKLNWGKITIKSNCIKRILQFA